MVHVIFWGHPFYRLYPQKMFNCSEKRLNKHFNLRQIRFYRRGFLTLWLLSWNICPFAVNLSNIYVNIILFQIYDFTFLLLSFTSTTLCFILRGFERNNLKKIVMRFLFLIKKLFSWFEDKSFMASPATQNFYRLTFVDQLFSYNITHPGSWYWILERASGL